ncbi:FIST N-terminal domain-containing protein [Sulfuricurvum sp.]|uniref:FIST N-terminal domain-containing protein n=1 Tax=Sulfuricurvum sp. TaxID=2025608 RepID=UPI002D74AF1D|nr:FIST N-terminal domain-containing protein [Sulfuricurvum sp.]HZF71597.1 FIST N-terminal domain-containing protein [Sulfuricurvum sp.]
MITRTFEYKDLAQQQWLDEYENHRKILVQIFCGNGKETLQESSAFIKKKLPHSIIIGTTTDGEINNTHILTHSTIISVSVFTKTEITSASVDGIDCFQNGVDLAKKLVKPDTKLLILFTDGSTSNGEAFLKGIESVDNQVMVCGGMAGDNGQFTQTYICENETMLEHGAVGVALNSDKLSVYNSYKFDWSPIGIEHTIDEIRANRVYKISGMPAVDFYEKYLGSEVAKALPKTGIEFPLIMDKNGFKVARAVIAKHDDGSMSFAGNLNVGDKVRLGFGNAELIIQQSFDNSYQAPCKNMQSYFVYSCMARRRYMPSLINIEMEPFVKNAPTAGFFSYAEFYHHDGHNELLNQTFTVIGLCESDCIECAAIENKAKDSSLEKDDYAITVGALAHLIAQSADDYEQQKKRLEEEQHYSQSLLKSQDLFIKYAVHETNTPLSIIMGNIELYEVEHGKNPYLCNIEAAMKNVCTIYDDLSYLLINKTIEYPKHTIDLVDYVRSRVEFFNIVAKKANVSFIFTSPEEEFLIYFNESQLQRIIDNNLTNAIKYTKENEPIYIVIVHDKSTCKVIFKSKSSEIENPNKIFEQFYRESSQQEGFGLGLNLVKEICNNEDVAFQLSSTKEETSFTYEFKEAYL